MQDATPFLTDSNARIKGYFATTGLWILLGASGLTALSGCQSTKSLFSNYKDGSLAYQEAQQIEPLQLPADQRTAPFVPLYPTPDLGVSTIDVESDSGKRYELPKPYRRVPVVGETYE